MTKCGLGDFKRYCTRNNISEFKVTIDHYLSGSFSSVRITLVPDMVYFKDKHGNSLSVHGITSVCRDGNQFAVDTNYFGNKVTMRISCV